MKQIFIEQLQPGMAVNDCFVLTEKLLAQKKDGNPYLMIKLADRTGSIRAVAWDQPEELAAAANVDEIVRVKARANEYQGRLQLQIQAMAKVPEKEVNADDYLSTGRHDVQMLFERLVKLTQSMETICLKELFEAFWQDDDFVARFKVAPAAKKMHHAYRGGLLEHTLSMASLADKVARHYEGVDRDMLVAGAVLHDIGKTEELGGRFAIDYTDIGRLIGHIPIGCRMIAEKAAQIDHFPPEKLMLLQHMIISHHGEKAFGSPEPPKTIEATLLHFVDEIDSKINGIRQFVASDGAEQGWTGFHRLWGRHFYLGRPSTPESSENT